ncbi:TCR/Tet family MFS transporter [Caulobacter sp. KR2-114]|uniref:TCR/Tet family MFS transporter n=1 Tax=Caulobacter sp. KR2-114 TaxID=3400912 RepID=UPI003C019BB2
MADAPSTATDSSTPGARQAAFGFIFASAVASALSIGIMVPILPNLLKQFSGGDTASAAQVNVVFATCGGAMSFLAGPVLGLLSDRYGRRPVLLVSLSGLGLDFLFMAFAPSLGWLFVGRLISGATSAVFSTANAYVADVTPPERRARAFGWMGAAFSVGFLVGPALGGLLGDINLRLPFMAGAALTLLNALYGFFVLPESHPPERRTISMAWRKANPVGALRLLSSHHELLALAGIYFLNQIAQMIWPSIYVLYVGYRYGWTPRFIGFAMMAGSVLGVGVQSFVVGPVIRRFGERGAVLAGASAATLAFIWYGLAPTGWIYLLGIPISCFGGLMIPGLQGLMTQRVSPSEQGQLQGANQSLAGLASMIGPSLFGLPFSWAIEHPRFGVPGIGMLEGAAICATCAVVAIVAARRAAPAPDGAATAS